MGFVRLTHQFAICNNEWPNLGQIEDNGSIFFFKSFFSIFYFGKDTKQVVCNSYEKLSILGWASKKKDFFAFKQVKEDTIGNIIYSPLCETIRHVKMALTSSPFILR